jgi:hypothetical protein
MAAVNDDREGVAPEAAAVVLLTNLFLEGRQISLRVLDLTIRPR